MMLERAKKIETGNIVMASLVEAPHSMGFYLVGRDVGERDLTFVSLDAKSEAFPRTLKVDPKDAELGRSGRIQFAPLPPDVSNWVATQYGLGQDQIQTRRR